MVKGMVKGMGNRMKQVVNRVSENFKSRVVAAAVIGGSAILFSWLLLFLVVVFY